MSQGAKDLAYACLQETTKQVDPKLTEELQAVKRAVTDARYADLERYLKNGEWQKADDETYRLMITTVGKEEGQYFKSEELFEFPCEDLKTIDQLWRSHSDGKYCFSVQKEIYLNCGGVADGKYHYEAFKQFGDEVAWRQDNSWEFDIEWERNGPRGHLPVARFWGYEKEQARYFSRGAYGLDTEFGRQWGSLLSHRDL